MGSGRLSQSATARAHRREEFVLLTEHNNIDIVLKDDPEKLPIMGIRFTGLAEYGELAETIVKALKRTMEIEGPYKLIPRRTG